MTDGELVYTAAGTCSRLTRASPSSCPRCVIVYRGHARCHLALLGSRLTLCVLYMCTQVARTPTTFDRESLLAYGRGVFQGLFHDEIKAQLEMKEFKVGAHPRPWRRWGAAARVPECFLCVPCAHCIADGQARAQSAGH